jgi:hypothetical protein
MPDEELLKKEWEVARELLANGNSRLHEMRKAGFSLVTAILTAISLFLDEKQSTNTAAIATGIAAVSVVLLIAMCLTERGVRLLQGAASARATVIERHLGLELSGMITYRYEREGWNRLLSLTYALFVVAACGVAWSIASADPDASAIPIVLIGVAGIGLVLFYAARFGGPGDDLAYGDWSACVVTAGDRRLLRIMFTALERSKGKWPFKEGETIWEIRTRPTLVPGATLADTASHVALTYAATKEDELPQRCRIWLADVTTFEGLNDLWVFHGRGKDKKVQLRAMERRLVVPPK